MRLFLRTEDGQCSTVVLTDVGALNTSNFMAGNIIFGVVLVKPEELTIVHIEQLYLLEPAEAGEAIAQKLLRNAQQQCLSVLEITPTYGAACAVLFRTWEILPNHVLPQVNSPVPM